MAGNSLEHWIEISLVILSVFITIENMLVTLIVVFIMPVASSVWI